GKPLLIVYRVNILPDAKRTAEIWRHEAGAAGIGEIYLCAAQSFGILDPTDYEFDAAVEFPPHGVVAEDLAERVEKINPRYGGAVYDYLVTANSLIHKSAPDYTLFKGVMPAWDNSARRQDNGNVFLYSSPEAYEYWLGKAVEMTVTRHR